MTTRIRSKGSAGNGAYAPHRFTETGYAYFPFNGTFVNAVGDTLSSDYVSGFDTRESIEDRVKEKAELKPVNHTSRKCEFVATPWWFEWRFSNLVHNGSPRSGVGRLSSQGSAAVVRAKASYGASVPPDNRLLARGRIPRMSPERLSTLNNLYELRDLANVLQKIPIHLIWAVYRGRLAGGRKAAREWLLQLRKDVAGSPVKALVSLINTDLAWKFGWKPFIGDLQKAQQLVSRVDSQLSKYLNVPFTVAGRASDTAATRFGPFTEPSQVFVVESTDVVVEVTRTTVSGLHVKFKPAFFNRPDKVKLFLLSEQLGFHPTAEKVWEAVPYSFVLDWFIPITTFLEQFNALQIDSSMLDVSSYWESTLLVTEVTATTMVVAKPNSSAQLQGSFVVPNQAKHTTRSYVRSVGSGRPGFHPGVYFPPVRLPKLGQWFTGMELTIQKLLGKTR